MINIEDIKVGKTYLLPFEVIKINDTDIHMRNGGVKGIFQPEELTESSRKSAPQYFTRRKFRKRDKGCPFSVNDRGNAIGVYNFLTGKFTPVSWQGSIEGTYERAVEECKHLYAEWRKEPYSVHEYEEVYEVQKGLLTYSVFYKVKYGARAAKAAAKAECARLNAEWRKEHSND